MKQSRENSLKESWKNLKRILFENTEGILKKKYLAEDYWRNSGGIPEWIPRKSLNEARGNNIEIPEQVPKATGIIRGKKISGIIPVRIPGGIPDGIPEKSFSERNAFPKAIPVRVLGILDKILEVSLKESQETYKKT